MRKRFIVMCCLSVMLLFTAACTGDPEPGQAPGEASEPGNSDNPAESGQDAQSFPLSEPVELNIFGVRNPNVAKDFSELAVFRDLQAKTNVTVHWNTVSGSDFTERKNLIFASMDLPDAFYGSGVLTNNEVVRYGVQGLLIPLEDLIAEYAPNLSAFLEERPNIRAQITAPDGHIYALPRVNEFDPASAATSAFFINKDWLDQVGMGVPETTEQLYEVLKAFKDKDLNGNGSNDEIPLSFLFKDAISGIHAISGAFGKLDPPWNHLHIEDGTVYFTPMEPEYKEYVNYLHRLYADGLIDPEVFTHESQVYDAKIRSEERIVGALFGWSRSVLWGQEQDWDYVPVPALEGPDGDRLWLKEAPELSIGSFAITSQNEHPEITMMWIDQVYDEVTSVEHAFGPYDSHLYDAEDGKIGLHWPPDGVTEPAFRHQEAPGASGVYIIGDSIQRRPSQAEKRELLEFYDPYLPDEIFPRMLMSEEDVNRLAVLEPELLQEDGFIDSKFAEWVVNGNVEQDWDGYVTQLKRMNIEEIISIYQENYDRLRESLE